MKEISLKRLYYKSALKSSILNLFVLVLVTFLSLKIYDSQEKSTFANSISLKTQELEQIDQFILTNNLDALDLLFIEAKSTRKLENLILVDEIEQNNCSVYDNLTLCGDNPLNIYQKLPFSQNKYVMLSSENFQTTHSVYFYLICIMIFIFNILTAYFSSIFAQKEIKKQIKDIEEGFNDNELSHQNILEFNKLNKIISSAHKSITENEVAKGNIKIIKKLQHDIDSPMTALEFFLLESKKFLSEELRNMGRQSLNRIQDIINTLKINEEDSILEESSKKEVLAIYPILKRIVSEKRIEYKNRTDVFIILDTATNKDHFVEIKKSDFYRAISNIINNAVEAKKLADPIYIKIKLEKVTNQVSISISDNGVGIDSQYIDEIFEYGKSFNKNSSGIGLNQAKDYIESESGKLTIDSSLGEGTTIQISLNEVEAPIWYSNCINLSSKKIVVVDDDQSIHNLWNEKLLPITEDITHLYSSEEFEQWASSKDLKDYYFLVDLELIGSIDTGINLINAYQLQSRSVLVTSHFMDTDVQSLCTRFGIKMIPKESVLNISVSFAKNKTPKRIVLIDDDRFTHLNWKRSAKNNGIELLSFYSVEDFLNESHNLDFDTPIYVDSNLGDGQKGEILSEAIHNKGFKNIILATGAKKVDIKVPFWIKKVQGKGFYVQH